MTEAEWLAGTDPTPMLKFLEGKANDRKLRLFGVAICRQIWALMLDERCRNAVEASEQYADGLITETRLDHLSEDANESFEEAIQPSPERNDIDGEVANAASYTSNPSLRFELLKEAVEAIQRVAPSGLRAEQLIQSHFLRDIFGNPFRPVVVDPTWLTSTVTALASQMYESRDFSPMPILADALQDAGCDDDSILNHCRSEGPHVRGCWVVDLVLGKE